MKNQANRYVRIAMYARGISQVELAKEIGKSIRTLNLWLKDELPEEKQQALIEACERVSARKGM